MELKLNPVTLLFSFEKKEIIIGGDEDNAGYPALYGSLVTNQP